MNIGLNKKIPSKTCITYSIKISFKIICFLYICFKFYFLLNSPKFFLQISLKVFSPFTKIQLEFRLHIPSISLPFSSYFFQDFLQFLNLLKFLRDFSQISFVSLKIAHRKLVFFDYWYSIYEV